MLRMQILDDSAADMWDAFVESAENGTPFHLHEWLLLCERHQGAKLIKLAFYDEDKIVCLFPLFIKRFFVFKVGASPMVVEDTPYMGPIFNSEKYFSEVMEHVGHFAKSCRIQFLRFVLKKKCNEAVLIHNGFKHFTHHTHVLDLWQGIDKLWKKMEGRARTAIRKAEASGVRVSFVDGLEYLDRYYDLYTRLYAWRDKTPPNSKSFFRQILTSKLRRHTKMVAATIDSILCAAAIFVHYKDSVYYLDAVTDKNYNKYNGSSAIQWHAISWATENGLHYYDFVGSNHAWLAKFKASFGGKMEDYSLIEKASSPWIFELRQWYGSSLKPMAQKYRSRMLKGQ